MTQPVWPYELVHPPSFPVNGTPTHTEMNKLQDQLATAADGRVWTDIAALKTLSAQLAVVVSSINFGRATCYDRVSRRWLTFGNSVAGDPEVAYTCSGARFKYLTSADGGAGGAHDIAPRSAWANNAGVILMGGLPSGTTDRKLRESTDGGATWTYRVIAGNDAQVVNPVVYSESLLTWFASVGGNAGAGLFSSTDRITWSLQAAAGGAPLYLTVRNDPTALILGTLSQAAGATTGYFRSANGTTWTTETFPVTLAGSNQPTWSNYHGKFFVPATAGIYASETGLTSSWSLVSASGGGLPLASFGRALIRGDGFMSIDAGVTWFEFFEAPSSPAIARIVAAEGRGVMMDTNSPPSDFYISQQIGF